MDEPTPVALSYDCDCGQLRIGGVRTNLDRRLQLHTDGVRCAWAKVELLVDTTLELT